MGAGAIVVPDVVICRDGHFPTHPPLAAMLGRVGGAVFSGGTVVATAGAKRALLQPDRRRLPSIWRAPPWPRRRRGTRSRSQCCARSATRRAGPCRWPHWWRWTAPDGSGSRRVARAALGRPRELPALVALAAEAALARRALSRRVDAVMRAQAEGERFSPS